MGWKSHIAELTSEGPEAFQKMLDSWGSKWDVGPFQSLNTQDQCDQAAGSVESITIRELLLYWMVNAVGKCGFLTVGM